MRVLVIASALVLACASAALAQPRPRPDITRDAVRVESVGEYIDTCINSEAFEGEYMHYFRASGPRTYVHVTSQGLLISAEGRAPGVEGETSPAIEARLGPQIEALRAAAASNSRVRLRHNERYYVTQIAITYRNRCS